MKDSVKAQKYAFLMALIPKGKNNAVQGKDVDNALRIDARQRYALIEDARKAGCIICSCNNGYFRPENNDEMLKYYLTSRKRAITILATLKTARRKLIANGITVK